MICFEVILPRINVNGDGRGREAMSTAMVSQPQIQNPVMVMMDRRWCLFEASLSETFTLAQDFQFSHKTKSVRHVLVEVSHKRFDQSQ